jgi:hypothetical protein
MESRSNGCNILIAIPFIILKYLSEAVANARLNASIRRDIRDIEQTQIKGFRLANRTQPGTEEHKIGVQQSWYKEEEKKELKKVLKK